MDSSPPSQPYLRCVLGQLCHAWQSFGVNSWPVTLLRDGYKVPFHHFPPVSLEPRELPSCFLGSVLSLALREEVSKMPQESACDPVDQPVQGSTAGCSWWSR